MCRPAHTASLQAKVDAELSLKLLPMLRAPYANARGMVWRAALLLLPILAAEAPLQLPAAWASSGSAAGAAGGAVQGSAAGEQPAGEGAGQPPLQVHLPQEGSGEATATQQLQTAAAQLASAERRRGMAAAIVLALSRMQLRRRLYDEAAFGLVQFVKAELGEPGARLSNARDIMNKVGKKALKSTPGRGLRGSAGVRPTGHQAATGTSCTGWTPAVGCAWVCCPVSWAPGAAPLPPAPAALPAPFGQKNKK